MQIEKFPALHTIKFSSPDSPEHYTLPSMIVWVTVPYAFWQLSYHFLITIRRREKIAAGRPTSFTWLRRSYAKNFLGKFVLSLPEPFQEPSFMLIQYIYALLTMLPCPIWFWYRWASAAFLMVVFAWASYNGARYYIEVFGKRMEKELRELKKEVQKWQATPEGRAVNGNDENRKASGEGGEGGTDGGATPGARTPGTPAASSTTTGHGRTASVDEIPLLDSQKDYMSRHHDTGTSTGNHANGDSVYMNGDMRKRQA